jgi:hypothetical protein
MCVSVELRDWALFTPSGMFAQEVKPFIEMVQNVGRAQGFDIPVPVV